jgi:hypothetical protein
MHLEPATSVIKELGGVTVVSARLGVNPTTVRRFRYPKEKAGTGGSIPNEYIFDLLKFSCEIGNPLPVERLVLTPAQRAELENLSEVFSDKGKNTSSPETGKNRGAGL